MAIKAIREEAFNYRSGFVASHETFCAHVFLLVLFIPLIEFWVIKSLIKPTSNDLVNAQNVEIVTFRIRPEHRIYSAFSHAGHLTFQKSSSGQLLVNY